jgi:anti-sigma factor RsiW
MSHLGQRLSALIDGELDPAERDRVLVHLARCDACRGEVIALRTLKRRMSALGELAAAGDAALTSKLMGLANSGDDPLRPDRFPVAGWPRLAAVGQAPASPQTRPNWYFGAAAVAVCVAGLGTAVFMVGGVQQLPAPKVTPAVDVYYTQHEYMTGVVPASTTGRAGSGAAARSGLVPSPALQAGTGPQGLPSNEDRALHSP